MVGPQREAMRRMTRAALLFVSSLALAACGGQTFDVAPGGDGDVDSGTGSDSSPSDTSRADDGVDAPPPDAPPVDWTSCGDVTECELTSVTCCGTCGEPTTSDVTAIAKVHDAEWRSAVCGPGPGACPGCASRPNPDLRVTCTAAHCRVLDVHTDAVSACESDADCMVRAPECCEPCGAVSPYDLVALSRAQLSTYLAETCPSGGTSCPDCAPSYPAGVTAKCDDTKHCVLVGVGP